MFCLEQMWLAALSAPSQWAPTLQRTRVDFGNGNPRLWPIAPAWGPLQAGEAVSLSLACQDRHSERLSCHPLLQAAGSHLRVILICSGKVITVDGCQALQLPASPLEGARQSVPTVDRPGWDKAPSPWSCVRKWLLKSRGHRLSTFPPPGERKPQNNRTVSPCGLPTGTRDVDGKNLKASL